MQLSRRSVLSKSTTATVLALAAPGFSLPGAFAQSEPTQGGTLRIATTVDADSLDPHESVGLAARGMQAVIFDRLVYRADDGTFMPWLAESWDVSSDGLEITFKLVEDQRFTDDTPVNAEAVKYTFDRMLEPDRASSAATQFPPMEIEVISEFEVKFALHEPFAPFLSSLSNPAGGIMSPTAAEAAGTDFGQQPVGSGPFMLQSWSKDTTMVLSRNPNYKTIRSDIENQGPAHLDEVIYEIVVEDSTRVNAIRAGDVEVSSGSYTLAGQFENNDDIQLIIADAGASNIVWLGLNHRKAPFDDVRVRQALAWAVDPQEIIDVVYFGYAARNQTMIPTGVAGYNPELGAEFGYSYDPDKARELLDEAGWTLADGQNVREKDGTRLSVEVLSWTSSTVDRATQLIQAQLADVGVEVTINLMEAGVFLQEGKEGHQNFDYMRTTWDEPVILSRLFEGGGSFQNFQNEELDGLLESAATAMDWDQRTDLLDQINQMVLEQAIAVPLLTDYGVYLIRSNVQGWDWDASGWTKLNDVYLT